MNLDELQTMKEVYNGFLDIAKEDIRNKRD